MTGMGFWFGPYGRGDQIHFLICWPYERTCKKMTEVMDPRATALAAHRDYYSSGSYNSDRLNWTMDEFVSRSGARKVLEVGCGDGALLQSLMARGIEAVGIDVSSSGIERCRVNGLNAKCLDASAEPLPFPDNYFDLVISLETFEHLMNPHYAIREVRRSLRTDGTFLCSVPNPLTGHPYLYPGLFEYKNFRRFLQQSGFVIRRVEHWQWAPRDRILPRFLRSVPFLNGRLVAGGIRRIIENVYWISGSFPYFCYWLWTFECRKSESVDVDLFEALTNSTRPGSDSHFGDSR